MPTNRKELTHDVQLHLKLPGTLKTAFIAECYRHQKTQSEVMRGLIEKYLAQRAANRKRKR